MIKEFYLEPDGIQLIQEMTGLSYGTITSYALKRFGLKRRRIKSPPKTRNRRAVDPALEVTTRDVIREIIPYVVLIAVALFVFILYPGLILWLPGKML